MMSNKQPEAKDKAVSHTPRSLGHDLLETDVDIHTGNTGRRAKGQ
jgi:hypothetical protein